MVAPTSALRLFQDAGAFAVPRLAALEYLSPLPGGLLSGKYRRNHQPPTGTRQLTDWNEPPIYGQDKLYDTTEVLVEVATTHNVSAAQIALAWLLTRPTITSVIIGARTDQQLAHNLKATELTLSDDELAQLEQTSRPTLIYPYWHPNKAAATRLSTVDLTLRTPFLQD